MMRTHAHTLHTVSSLPGQSHELIMQRYHANISNQNIFSPQPSCWLALENPISQKSFPFLCYRNWLQVHLIITDFLVGDTIALRGWFTEKNEEPEPQKNPSPRSYLASAQHSCPQEDSHSCRDQDKRKRKKHNPASLSDCSLEHPTDCYSARKQLGLKMHYAPNFLANASVANPASFSGKGVEEATAANCM